MRRRADSVVLPWRRTTDAAAMRHRVVGDALPSFIFSFVVAEDEHEPKSRRSNQRPRSPQPGGGVHPPIPSEGGLGEVLWQLD